MAKQRKKKTTNKPTKKMEEVEVTIPEELEKRIGSELTLKDRYKGTEASASIRDMQKRIQRVMKDGKLTNLQQVTLENWAIMLTSENDSERAFATERVTKYLFAPKKEVIGVPVININCTFVGIKDAK